MGCSQKIRYLMFFSLWSVAILRTTDGTAITWYEPPPMTEITNNSFFHAANRSLTEGSANVPLSWNFSLSAGSNVITVTLSFKGATVVTMLPAVPNPTVEDPFNGRFGVSWNPSTKATLIINNVNTVDNGEFTCEVFTLAGSKTTLWTSKVQVTVFVPPRITDDSGNLTVTEGKDVTLECQVTGNPAPERTWTRLSDNSVFNGNLPNIRRHDTGGYRCTANNSVGSPATKDIFITVQYPPSTNISGNITKNDKDTVTLNCGEDGFPDPNITWTRLSDNNTVPETFNISGKQDEGYYRCTAHNGIGNPATEDIFITVTNYRPRNTNLEANLNNSTVVMNTNFKLTCSADANPPAKYELHREQNSLIRTTIGQDSFTNTTSINQRIKQVTYSCTPFNDYGVGPTETITVTVHYNPANVTLLANTTENKDCSDSLWVNFTCVASEKANPAVESYQLYRNEELISASDGGTWKEEPPEKGEYDYSCLAIHPVKNVRSSNNVTVTFNVLSQISVYLTKGNETLKEGGNVSLYCKISGFPKPTITWSKDGEPIDEPVQNSLWLNFTDIKRDKAGNYRCHANNTCGERDSEVKRIDVQYKPENVTLIVNITTSNNKVCADVVVNFTCTAEAANPGPDNYTLYENGRPVVQNMTSPGVWIIPLNTTGEVTYSCEARNSIGYDSSSNSTFTVGVPALVTVENATIVVKEGSNVTLFCKVFGFPSPNVSWVNNKSELMKVGDIWRIPNIRRNYTGEYNCSASNTCGNDSKRTVINVQYPPLATRSGRNFTVSRGSPASFDCAVDGNPEPIITWYKGSTAGGTVLSLRKAVSFRQTKLDDTGCYTCFASNFLGTGTITDCLEVELPPTPSPGKTPEPASKESLSPTTTVQTTQKESTEFVWLVTLTITNKDCNNFTEDGFRTEVKRTLEPFGLKDVGVAVRCGSVIVDLVLRFNQNLAENDVISTLKTAAEQKTFGSFIVDPSSIKSAPCSTTPSSPTSTGGTQECKRSSNDVILLAIIGVLVLIIILLLVFIIWQRKKGTEEKKRQYEVPPGDKGFYDNEVEMEDVNASHLGQSSSTQQLTMPGATYMDLQNHTRQSQSPSSVAEYAPLNLQTRSWEVAKNNVTVEKVIGKGAFGQVAKGTAIELPFRPGETTVAIKMLKANAPETDKKDLLSELQLMKTLKPHNHVIKLLGCVTESEPLMVLIEYVPYGDLLGYLRKSRGLNDTYYKDPDIKPQTTLTSEQLMKFAWQIADGMSYLSSRKIIHRDLAARNILVGEGETCKVTDFGMARDVQQENIYERKTRGRLPVKWTAYESLLYGTYTTKSDVWSYGVVLYEIFTIGGSPYPRMDGRKIASFLQGGYRMPKPQHVDDELYQIMMNCWQNEPEARPTFTVLTKQLRKMENQHKKLINMHIYDNQLYAKVEDLNV